MTGMTAYMDAHPLLWLVLGAIVIVTVLRVVAKLACLAVLVMGALIVGSAVLGLAKGIL